jgi:hypothetical protein
MLRPELNRLFRFWGGVALPVLLIVFAGGCGGGKGNVSGTVTVNGKPLPMGVIVFTPESGAAVAAEIIDGKYSASGVPSGTVKVSLDLRSIKLIEEQTKGKGGADALAAKYKKGAADDTTKQKSMNPPKDAKIPDEAREGLATRQQASEEANRRSRESLQLLKEIPDRYTDPNQSGWTVQVTTGLETTFDAQVSK